MAGACKEMMQKPRFGFMLSGPGIVFIILGVVILIEPRILLWFVALALIAMGIAMLMFARLVRKSGDQIRGMHG
jgi:uncharacterized membrane protein HdeD (DUF308 family)